MSADRRRGRGDDERRTRWWRRRSRTRPLVKTAAFGGDPNPGRILQAVGASGAECLPQANRVAIGDVLVITDGVIPAAYLEAWSRAAPAMR